jgi:FMN phosphatase YigB (HAD superfamily)
VVDPGAVHTITLDFGNTLVPVDRAGLERVVERTGVAVVARCGPFALEDFLAAWAEERDRQFAEEVPRFREVDLGQRMVRVLASLRGMASPPSGVPWDDEAAAALSDPEEVAFAIDTYSRAFVDAMPPPASVGPMLRRLARTRRVAILSNWPLAATIDRYVEAAGWASSLAAVIVSQRVGAIKPHRAIFLAAEAALGLGVEDRVGILHVGDDWAADVVGAKAAGWLAAYLARRPEDSPLPSSARSGELDADIELGAIEELERVLPSTVTG